MHLLPPSPKPFGVFADTSTARSHKEDLQVALELERQILEARTWRRLKPVIQEVMRPFIGKKLNDATILQAQRLLQETLGSLGSDFHIPGHFILKKDPQNPFSIVLEFEDE